MVRKDVVDREIAKFDVILFRKYERQFCELIFGEP